MTSPAADYDLAIVGGGPSGLAAAIRARQLGRTAGRDISVCLLEKEAGLGASAQAGMVLDPKALSELFPDWQDRGAAFGIRAAIDQPRFFARGQSSESPAPDSGSFVIDRGRFNQWLGRQAQDLGVDLYLGFEATEVLFGEDGRVRGIARAAEDYRDVRLTIPGSAPVTQINSRQTIFAGGYRSALTELLKRKYQLEDHGCRPTYGIGIRELWKIDPAKHRPGLIVRHSFGFSAGQGGYGACFLFHLPDSQIALSYVDGLDYKIPWRSPHEDFERHKRHPAIREILAGAIRLGTEARALNESGRQAIPTLHFPGGVLAGDSAGFFNIAKIQGSHLAIKSGMLAAEAIFDLLGEVDHRVEATAYGKLIRKSWIWNEFHPVRNIRSACPCTFEP